jgi:hypothetical protein
MDAQRDAQGFGYETSSLAGIFTAELTALFVTLRHNGEVIQPPDSLGSVKDLLSRKISHRTHPLVNRCVATYWKMELRLK